SVPYINTPVFAGSSGANHSLIDMVQALMAGAQVEVSFILVLLMSIVVAGAFISLFHHVGGYIILLGGMSFMFMALKAIGSFQGLQSQAEIGLYVALFAAILIISSSLSRPETGIRSDSDWS
ncbi:MAG: hypothetical protein SXQ77_12600, partial [Halobacteria archaeon]|nr:hypothetical protein [Halobacteria archaeon]